MLQLTLISGRDKLTNHEKQLFLENLQQALDNGYSLNQSIQILPSIWPKRAEIFENMHQKMKNGEKFGNLLNEIGFSKTISLQINLALQHGNLAECLKQLTKLERLKNEQIKKLRSELSYPLVLGIMMITLLFFMQNFLDSQFQSEGLQSGDIIFFSLAIAIIVVILLSLRIAKLLKRQDLIAFKKLIKYPIIGSTIKLYGHYLVTYELGILLAAGFSLQQICDFLIAQDKASLQYGLGIKVAKKLQEGKELQEIIKEEAFLPDRMILLLSSGSQKSELSKNCLLLGKNIFAELTYKIEKLVVNVQPICFVIIGLCIVGMYLKLLLPMYDMMQKI